MDTKNITIRELRILQYKENARLFPYIDDWKKNPYTFLKTRFYTEASAFLIYLLLKTKLKPNSITIIYGLLGLSGGILIALSNKITIITGVCIFFFKGVLDWSDGYFARLSGQTSITGAILDPYGGLLGSLGFQMGLGFYVAEKSGMVIFYYLTALILLFYAANLYSFGCYAIFLNYFKPEILKTYLKRNPQDSTQKIQEKPKGIANKYKKIYYFIESSLDMRARTVDFICFLLLVEIFKPIFITWIVFLGFVLQRFLIFCGSFYIIARGGWAERKLEEKATDFFHQHNCPN